MLPLWRSQQEIFTHTFYHFQLSGIIDGYQHKKKTIERDRERQTDIHTDREQRDRNREHNIFLKKHFILQNTCT